MRWAATGILALQEASPPPPPPPPGTPSHTRSSRRAGTLFRNSLCEDLKSYPVNGLAACSRSVRSRDRDRAERDCNDSIRADTGLGGCNLCGCEPVKGSAAPEHVLFCCLRSAPKGESSSRIDQRGREHGAAPAGNRGLHGAPHGGLQSVRHPRQARHY